MGLKLENFPSHMVDGHHWGKQSSSSNPGYAWDFMGMRWHCHSIHKTSYSHYIHMKLSKKTDKQNPNVYCLDSFFRPIHQSHDGSSHLPMFSPGFRDPKTWEFPGFVESFPWRSVPLGPAEALEMAALGSSHCKSSARAVSAAEVIWSSAGTWGLGKSGEVGRHRGVDVFTVGT